MGTGEDAMLHASAAAAAAAAANHLGHLDQGPPGQADCILPPSSGNPADEPKFKEDHHLVLPVATPLAHHQPSKLVGGSPYDHHGHMGGHGGHHMTTDHTGDKSYDVMSGVYNHHARYLSGHSGHPGLVSPTSAAAASLETKAADMGFGVSAAAATAASNPFSINRFLPGSLNLSSDHHLTSKQPEGGHGGHYDYSAAAAAAASHFPSHESMYYPPPLYSVHHPVHHTNNI